MSVLHTTITLGNHGITVLLSIFMAPWLLLPALVAFSALP